MREFYPKYWKCEEILRLYFYFLSDFLIEVYLLKRFLCLFNSLNKMLTNSGKWKENTGKNQGNLSAQNCENHETISPLSSLCAQLKATLFGSFGNEPMQLCSVCHVVLSSASVSLSVSVQPSQ